MSKKSQWSIMSSTNPTLLMTREEKVAYEKRMREYRFKMFKWGQKLEKMPPSKPKLTHSKPVKEDTEY